MFLASTITRCISISAFAFLTGALIGITSSAMELKICAITAGMKKYKSIIKKKKKKTFSNSIVNKIVLNAIEALIATTLVNSNNSPAEFVLTNNVLKEICDMKKFINE